MVGKRAVVWLMAAFMALALPRAAFAAEAEGFVKAKQQELMELLRTSKTPQTDHKVETLCDALLDYQTMAKESLGDYWSELKEPEKKEFHSVLKQLVQRAYRKNLTRILNFDLTYQGEVKAKDGTLVKTVAKDRTNAREEPVAIDFNVHKVDGAFKIQDIVTEGSSLTGNYRSQFRKIIKKKGFEELIRRMKARLEKGES